MQQAELKQRAAQAALAFVKDDMIVGVGTGSTVNYFIEGLSQMRHRIEGAVASSVQTETLLKAHGIPVLDLNSVAALPIYVDGADEINHHKQMIKGGGAALTREKIVASVAQQFICIVDASKQVNILGEGFQIPVEVIPMARSYVAREIVKLGGSPEYRQGVVTDNGHHILDVYHMPLTDPLAMETTLNQITGVVCNGIFAARRADIALIAQSNGEVSTE